MIKLSGVRCGFVFDYTYVKFKGEEEQTSHESGWTNVLKQLDVVTAKASVRHASA
jgi:hypothetical protein